MVSLPARAGAGTSVFDFLAGRFRARNSLKLVERTLFGISVHGIALYQHSEVNAVRVKFGSIDAGELTLSVD